jgi:2-C-methyl-D-erythritol 4-phosphate cytidylyltransferase
MRRQRVRFRNLASLRRANSVDSAPPLSGGHDYFSCLTPHMTVAQPSFRFWVVIPAAGRGTRMGEGGVPKQYSRLADKTVIEHSAQVFLDHPQCAGIVVSLAKDDAIWSGLPLAAHPRVSTAMGGAQRTDSVRAGLDALQARCDARDWVLVHDAARPCLTSEELSHLLASLQEDEIGGLLAAPVVDTLKRADEAGRVDHTVDRARLWRALTPQMFRFGLLHRALAEAAAKGIVVTDEAQAVELIGLKPRLVAGNADNIKITLPEDLVRAESILARRSHS